MQGAQIVGLEQLDPRTMEQLSDLDICNLLYEHAFWAHAVEPEPLTRQQVADTVHRM